MKNINKFKLQTEQKELIKEYQELEKEKNNAETVIICQTKRNKITERQKEINFRICEIESELLEEKENIKNLKIKKEIKYDSGK